MASPGTCWGQVRGHGLGLLKSAYAIIRSARNRPPAPTAVGARYGAKRLLPAFVSRFQIKNLSGTTVPEYKMQQIKRSRLILLHYGIFKIGWDWLILLCTFYVAIMVPYNAAFVTMEGSNERASIVSDVIVEMLFIIGKPLIISCHVMFNDTKTEKCSQGKWQNVCVSRQYLFRECCSRCRFQPHDSIVIRFVG